MRYKRVGPFINNTDFYSVVDINPQIIVKSADFLSLSHSVIQLAKIENIRKITLSDDIQISARYTYTFNDQNIPGYRHYSHIMMNITNDSKNNWVFLK